MENRFVKCANYINYTWQHKKAFCEWRCNVEVLILSGDICTTLTSYFATWLFVGARRLADSEGSSRDFQSSCRVQEASAYRGGLYADGD